MVSILNKSFWYLLLGLWDACLWFFYFVNILWKNVLTPNQTKSNLSKPLPTIFLQTLLWTVKQNSNISLYILRSCNIYYIFCICPLGRKQAPHLLHPGKKINQDGCQFEMSSARVSLEMCCPFIFSLEVCIQQLFFNQQNS